MMIKGNGYKIVFDKACEVAAEFLSQRLDKMLTQAKDAKAVEFVLSTDSLNCNFNGYKLETQGNSIYMSAKNLNLLFHAVSYYLKEFCKWGLFWGGEQAPQLKELPLTRGNYTKFNLPENLLYFNPCTFGYSTVWWDEKRWLEELDWMLSHGINMPLALMGQEYIWKKVWQKFGVKNLDEHFTGPAFLPWQRMGNVNGINGPLPDEWMEWDRKRQHFFLKRARELGMKPVLQGFAGFVPLELKELFPGSEFDSAEWCSFKPTLKLDPSDPLYMEIGKAYMTELIKEYGTDHYYLADAFNEMAPPSDVEPREYAYRAGNAIYESMKQVDADAVWALQSWQFLGYRDYWQPPVIEAFFEAIPPEKLLIIDTGAENSAIEIWKYYKGFNGRPWIWSVFHNGGGIPTVFGDIDDLTKSWYGARMSPDGQSMAGAGISCEGIETNPVYYELCSDLFSERYDGNIDKWLEDYCIRRYGIDGSLMLPAMKELFKEVYGPAHGRFQKSGWTYFSAYQGIAVMEGHEDSLWQVPQMTGEVRGMDQLKRRAINPADIETYRERNFTGTLANALEIALEAGEKLCSQPLYLLDLVDITRQFVGDAFDRIYVKFMDAKDNADTEVMKETSSHMMNLLDLQVRVLSTHEHFHLGPWIRNAEKISENPEYKKLYRFNAKDQILRWGSTILFDYAKKDWAELVRDVYIPRMEMYLDQCIEAVSQGRKFNDKEYLEKVNELEITWENSETPLLQGPVGKPAVVCKEALDLVKSLML